MLVAGLLVVVLHRHRWNHLADLQRRSVIGWGGRERERERERERAMDRENVSGDARGLEADLKDWKAAGLVGGGWQDWKPADLVAATGVPAPGNASCAKPTAGRVASGRGARAATGSEYAGGGTAAGDASGAAVGRSANASGTGGAAPASLESAGRTAPKS